MMDKCAFWRFNVFSSVQEHYMQNVDVKTLCYRITKSWGNCNSVHLLYSEESPAFH